MITQDVFGHLHDEYMKSFSDADNTLSATDEAAVKAFAEFSRTYLQENTPISMTFEDAGVGFQLQDGTHLVFVEQLRGTTLDGLAVPVTTASTAASGMSNMKIRDDAVPVTGDQGSVK